MSTADHISLGVILAIACYAIPAMVSSALAAVMGWFVPEPPPQHLGRALATLHINGVVDDS